MSLRKALLNDLTSKRFLKRCPESQYTWENTTLYDDVIYCNCS